MPSALSDETRRALAHIARQLEGHAEALRGLCVRGETVQTKHGRIGPPSRRETVEERIENPDEYHTETADLIPFLTGEGVDRTEVTLPDGTRGVRAVVAGPPEAEIQSVDFGIETAPPRLVFASVHPPRLPRLAGWLVDTLATDLRFEDVRGVPMVVEMRMRMRTRGIGRVRMDHETVSTVRYEPCD